MTGIRPVALGHHPRQCPPDIRGHPQAEQIRQPLPLCTRHHRLDAPCHIAPHQRRPAAAPKPMQQRPQASLAVLRRVFIARLHIHSQHQTKVRHQVRVVAVRGTSRLVRVVTHHRPFLMPIQRLDRAIDVEHPWLAQQRRGTVVEMCLQPRQAGRLVDLRQAAAHRVLAHNLLHAQQPRVHRIAPQRRDMGVAVVPRQHRQQHCAQHVALGRRVRAAERQRAIRHPAGEKSSLLQILDEEWQLPQRRHMAVAVPFDVHPAGKRLRSCGVLLYRWLFTRRVR